MRRLYAFVLVLLVALVGRTTIPSSAATVVWDGGSSVDSDWMTPANWAGDLLPNSGDSLEFPGGAARLGNNNNFPTGTAFTSIVFSNNAASYSLGGNRIALSGIGLTTSAGTGINTVSLPLTLNITTSILTVSGAEVRLNGVIDGPGGPTKTGTGIIVLSGANSYTGATTINGGTIRLGASNVLPDSTPVTLAAGTDFDVNGFNETIASLAGSGGVTMTAALTIGSASSSAYSGALTGAGGLTKQGSGTLTLSGNSPAYSGAISVTAGTLLVNANLSGAPVSVSGTGTLGGTGTVGAINVSTGGTLAPGTSPGILSGANAVLVAGTTFVVELNSNAAGTGYDRLTLTGTVNLGGATLSATVGSAAATGPLTIVSATGGLLGTFAGLPDGAFLTISGRSYRINYTATTAVLNQANRPPKVWDGGSLVDSSWMTPANWAGDAVPSPDDALEFPGGAARTTNDNDFPVGTRFTSIRFSGNATGYNLGGNGIELLIAGITALPTTGVNTLGMPLTLNFATDFALLSPAEVRIISAIGGSGGPSMAGAGLLLLSGANTYTGLTSINASGTIRLGASGAIPDNGTVAIGATGGTFDLNGFNETIGSLAGSSGAVTLSATLTTGNAASTSFLGVLNGAQGLVKQGTGTFTLSTNSAAYTGPISVTNGTLLVAGNLSGAPVSVSGSGVLGGIGTVKSINATAGTVSPGTSPGILNVSTTAVLNAGSTLRLELNGETPGTQYDRLATTGTATINGATLAIILAFPPPPGNTFDVVSATGGLSGTFAGTSDGSYLPVSGGELQVDYTATSLALTFDSDTDGDGYGNLHETSHGESPTTPCAIMRADVNHDHTVTIGDLAAVAAQFLQAVTSANQRLNQDGDGSITIANLALMASNFLQPISSCV